VAKRVAKTKAQPNSQIVCAKLRGMDCVQAIRDFVSYADPGRRAGIALFRCLSKIASGELVVSTAHPAPPAPLASVNAAIAAARAGAQQGAAEAARLRSGMTRPLVHEQPSPVSDPASSPGSSVMGGGPFGQRRRKSKSHRQKRKHTLSPVTYMARRKSQRQFSRR
jgi:hypothetical protein